MKKKERVVTVRIPDDDNTCGKLADQCQFVRYSRVAYGSHSETQVDAFTCMLYLEALWGKGDYDGYTCAKCPECMKAERV